MSILKNVKFYVEEARENFAHPFSWWHYYFHTSVEKKDFTDFDKFSDLDADSSEGISTDELIAAAKKDEDGRERVLDFFDALTKGGLSTDATRMAREWANNPEYYTTYIQLKQTQRSLERENEALNTMCSSENGEECKGIQDTIDFLNTKLGLTPDSPLYLTQHPGLAIYYVTKGVVDKSGNKEADAPNRGKMPRSYFGYFHCRVGMPFEKINIPAGHGQDWRGVRTHELGHAIVFEPRLRNTSVGTTTHLSYQNNIWFYEGLSEWLCEGGFDRVTDVRYFLDTGIDPLNSWHYRWKTFSLASGPNKYFRGYLAFKFIENTRGKNAVQQIYRLVAGGMAPEDAIKQTLDYDDIDQFYQDEYDYTQQWFQQYFPHYTDPQFAKLLRWLADIKNEDRAALRESPQNDNYVITLCALVKKYPGNPIVIGYLADVTDRVSLTLAQKSQINQLTKEMGSDDNFRKARDNLFTYRADITQSLDLEPSPSSGPLEWQGKLMFPGHREALKCVLSPWVTAKFRAINETNDLAERMKIFRETTQEIKVWEEQWPEDRASFWRHIILPNDVRYLLLVCVCLDFEYGDAATPEQWTAFMKGCGTKTFCEMTMPGSKPVRNKVFGFIADNDLLDEAQLVQLTGFADDSHSPTREMD